MLKKKLFTKRAIPPQSESEELKGIVFDKDQPMIAKSDLPKDDADWKKVLPSDLSFKVLRKSGTEHSFSSPLYKFNSDGVYICAGCNQKLFTSKSKFNSGSGWPSFTQVVDKSAIDEHVDNSLWSSRTEVRCSNCDGHLGHVFPDGPKKNHPHPTGLRYCINGVCLKFVKSDTNANTDNATQAQPLTGDSPNKT